MAGASSGNRVRRPARVYFERGVLLLVLEHAAEQLTTFAELRDLLRAAIGDEGSWLPPKRRPKGRTLAQLMPPVDWETFEARFRPPDDAEAREGGFRPPLRFAHIDPAARDRWARQLQGYRRPQADFFTVVSVPLTSKLFHKELLRRAIRINRLIKQSERYALGLGDGVALRAVGPNWLTGQSPQWAGGGGPGARPSPVDPGVVGPEYAGVRIGTDDISGAPFGFSFDDAGVQALVQGLEAARAVEVAILDAAPDAGQRDAALTAWGGDNPLLRSLLTSPGVTWADPAGAGLLMPPLPPAATEDERLALPGHDYDMSDHGLFVAGIVHSIAPHARLRMVRVLNSQGVGYVSSIAEALERIKRERSAAPAKGGEHPPLVINCSLYIAQPLAGHGRRNRRTTDDTEGVPEYDQLANEQAQDPALDTELRMLSTALEWVHMSLHDDNVIVVASAGNDWNRAAGLSQPQARLPAAFATVVGVGALGPRGSSASYSNKADEQSAQGLATLGGEVRPERLRPAGARPDAFPATEVDYAVPGEAILGAYTGAFPDTDGTARPNANGWGWWAGTSFAAPIISGALARMVESGRVPNLRAAHDALKTAPPPIPPGADEIVLARQGGGPPTP